MVARPRKRAGQALCGTDWGVKLLGDGVPLPVTAETPARILRTVEKENSYGGRRLSSATISRGGVTVRGKGVLEVLDGGSLEIVTGDLILAAGMIKADMLKEHLFPEVFIAPWRYLTSLNGARGDTWGTPQTLITATAPAWATRAIIITTADLTLVIDDMDNQNVTGNMKILGAATINSTRCPPSVFTNASSGYENESYNVPYSTQALDSRPVSIPENKAINLGFTIQTNIPSHIVLSRSWVQQQALIIWI